MHAYTRSKLYIRSEPETNNQNETHTVLWMMCTHTRLEFKFNWYTTDHPTDTSVRVDCKRIGVSVYEFTITNGTYDISYNVRTYTHTC